MPQIPEFTAQSPGITAPETGVEAFAQAGRRIGMFYHQAGQNIAGAVTEAASQAQKFVDHQEISHGAVGYAGLLGEFTDDWNDTLKQAIASGNANDPTIAGRFRAKWEDKLQAFTENFRTDAGQKWAEAHVDMLRNHIFEQTAAGMSTLAGMTVAPNIERVVNTLANAARANPSLVPDLIKKGGIIENSIGGVVGSAPNLRGEDVARITNETVQKAKERAVAGGALGTAEKAADPEKEIAKYVQSYGAYIPQPGEVDQMAKLARSYKRAAEYDQDRLKRLRDEQAQDESTDRKDEYIKDIYGDNPKATMRDIISDQTLSQADREHLIGVLKNADKPEAISRVSHDTWIDLMGRIRGGMTDDGPIWDALAAHTLNKADFDDLRKELDARKTPEGEHLAKAKDRFLKGIEPQIDKSLVGTFIDQDGKERFYELQWELDRRMDEYKRAGKDPYSLLDPSKPDYMGSKEALKRFIFPLNQQMKNLIQNGLRGGGNILPGGGTLTGAQIFDIPPGMSVDEAVKKYGSGAQVRAPNGKVKVLP